MVPAEDDAGRPRKPLDLVEPVVSPADGGPAPRVGLTPSPPPPVTRSDGGTWVFLAFVGFLVGQIAGYVLAVVAAAIAHRNITQVAKLSAPPEWYEVSGLVGAWIGFTVAPVLASWYAGTRRVLADMGVRFRPIDVIGIPIGVAAQGVVYLLYRPFQSHLHNYSAPVTKLTGASHGGGFVLIAVLVVVAGPFFEEVFFRGVLLRGLLRLLRAAPDAGRLARRAGVVGAIVLDGLLFGAAHGELEQFAGLALFGIVLAFISWRTGRQGMNMLAHASFNMVTVVAIATVVR